MSGSPTILSEPERQGFTTYADRARLAILGAVKQQLWKTEILTGIVCSALLDLCLTGRPVL
jgi:hypothetical protein